MNNLIHQTVSSLNFLTTGQVGIPEWSFFGRVLLTLAIIDQQINHEDDMTIRRKYEQANQSRRSFYAQVTRTTSAKMDLKEQ